MSRECRVNEVAKDVWRETDERLAEAERWCWMTRQQDVTFET